MSKGQTLQDPFLNSLRKDRIPVSIFLVNGIKLQGQIESFDQYVVLLKNTVSQMVYKHAISTVVPARNPRGSNPTAVGGMQQGGYQGAAGSMGGGFERGSDRMGGGNAGGNFDQGGFGGNRGGFNRGGFNQDRGFSQDRSFGQDRGFDRSGFGQDRGFDDRGFDAKDDQVDYDDKQPKDDFGNNNQ